MKVLLLSGGRESSYLAATLNSEIDCAIFFDYGQPHINEQFYAANVADKFNVRLVCHVLPALKMSKGKFVVPHRNLLMLTAAAALGASDIWLGANATDYALFADCRRPYLDRAEALLNVKIHTPLIYMKKSEISEKLQTLGVSLADTWSCYFPSVLDGGGLQPCGECAACCSFDD